MRTRDLQAIRTQLVERLQTLQASTAQALHEATERHTLSQEEPRDDPEEAERIRARDTTMIMTERDALLSQRIEVAIGRIDAGEYGVCMECDTEIEVPRLRAIPWAERCISCQEELEHARIDPSPSL
jgi:DnaK suppressor protein